MSFPDDTGVSALAAMVVALAITGDNGLPFTSVPDIAGRHWSGRALGTQNTVERMTVAAGRRYSVL